jgi:DNA invertase Pin-like site-specific DNA recombinase
MATVVEEQASGAKERPKLSELISKLTAGDRLIVYAIDRLGRSTRDLVTLFEELGSRGVILISNREGIIDRSTPMGNFMYNIMAAMAQMERDILIERIKTGLSRAKSEGKKLGRTYQHPKEVRDAALTMRKQGITYRGIAKKLGISVTSIRLYERKQA